MVSGGDPIASMTSINASDSDGLRLQQNDTRSISSPLCPLSGVNWFLDAKLMLRGRTSTAPAIQLARGGLAEMVTEALQRSSIDCARLLIQMGLSNERYDWTAIRKMAVQPDFPVLI